jgi:tripartite-type tricarboxylate transporter receptor subunit TctC
MFEHGKPVRLLVGFSKVSASNIVAQLLAPALGKALGVRMDVVCLPGDNGMRAIEETARAMPDGRTLCMTVPTHILGALLGRKAGCDVVRDCAAVALFARNPLVLAVSPALGIATLSDLVARAKSHPGELVYGASAIGGGPHLAALLFCDKAGVRMSLRVYAETHVLYDDLCAGRLALTFNNTMSALPLAAQGRLKLLGATSATRSAAAPAVPTFTELGLPGYVFENWVGVLAPAATPAPTIARLNEAVRRAVASSGVRDQLFALGMETVDTTPDQFAAHLRTEQARWTRFVADHADEFPPGTAPRR